MQKLPYLRRILHRVTRSRLVQKTIPSRSQELRASTNSADQTDGSAAVQEELRDTSTLPSEQAENESSQLPVKTQTAAIYEPLDVDSRQIRVLELLPGAGDDIISGILHITNISRTVTLTFEALLDTLSQVEERFLEKLQSGQASSSDIWRHCYRVFQAILTCRIWPCSFLIDFVRENVGHLSSYDKLDIDALIRAVQGIASKTRAAATILHENLQAFDSEEPSSLLSFCQTSLVISDYLKVFFSIVKLYLDRRHLGHDSPGTQLALNALRYIYRKCEGLLQGLVQELLQEQASSDSVSMSDHEVRELLRRLDARPVETEASNHHYLAFEAISYCWDRLPSMTDVQINGVTTKAQASAVVALRKFRLPERSRFLWIDAICIDQSNEEEKCSQIPLMGDIYRTATCTLAWLGQTDDTDHENNKVFMAFCEQLSHSVADEDSSVKSIADLKRLVIDIPKFSTPGSSQHHAFDRLEDRLSSGVAWAPPTIFERRWFTRLWIYQEIVNSRKIICYLGDAGIEWSRLRAAVDAFVKPESQAVYLSYAPNAYDPIPHIPAVYQFVQRMQYHEGIRGPDGVERLDLTLVDLAILSRDLGASDPRDKIFALLSMTSWIRYGRPLPERLRVNYSQSVPDCMCNATKAMIQESKSLLVLEQERAEVGDEFRSDEEVQAWPSWCPRWDKVNTAGDGIDTVFMDQGSINASGNRKLDQELLDNHDQVYEISLRGILADHIVECVKLDGIMTHPSVFPDTARKSYQSAIEELGKALQNPPSTWPSFDE